MQKIETVALMNKVGPRGSFLQLQRLSSPPPEQLKRIEDAKKKYTEQDRKAKETEAAVAAIESKVRKTTIWKGVVDDCADIDSMAKTTCKNKCRSEAQPSWCEDVVRRYCERDYARKKANPYYTEDTFCACYNSEVARSSQSPEVKALVSCFDAKCVRDGYKNPTMWDHSNKCPNLCQQMIDIGAGGNVSIGDINLSQKCEEVTRSDTDVKVTDGNGTVIDEETTTLSDDSTVEEEKTDSSTTSGNATTTSGNATTTSSGDGGSKTADNTKLIFYIGIGVAVGVVLYLINQNKSPPQPPVTQ